MHPVVTSYRLPIVTIRLSPPFSQCSDFITDGRKDGRNWSSKRQHYAGDITHEGASAAHKATDESKPKQWRFVTFYTSEILLLTD